MNESAVYNEADLAPFQKRLDELRDIVHGDKASGKHPEGMTKLLERQLKDCCEFTTFFKLIPTVASYAYIQYAYSFSYTH